MLEKSIQKMKKKHLIPFTRGLDHMAVSIESYIIRKVSPSTTTLLKSHMLPTRCARPFLLFLAIIRSDVPFESSYWDLNYEATRKHFYASVRTIGRNKCVSIITIKVSYVSKYSFILTCLSPL